MIFSSGTATRCLTGPGRRCFSSIRANSKSKHSIEFLTWDRRKVFLSFFRRATVGIRNATDQHTALKTASVKKLLFIKLKHIGDSLLLTPTLTAARAAYPQAQIWVVVRKGCEGILAGCPAIDRVLTSAAPETSVRKTFDWLNDLKLLREIRRQNFDYTFELTQGDRGRLLVGWSGAQFRCANDGVYRVPIFWRPWFNKLSTHNWTDEHQVEANFNFVNEFLPLNASEPPPLVFDRAAAV